MPDMDAHVFYSEEDRGYIAESKSRPGCCAFGETAQKAYDELCDARIAWDQSKQKLKK